jgi:hypothetical protein
MANNNYLELFPSWVIKESEKCELHTGKRLKEVVIHPMLGEMLRFFFRPTSLFDYKATKDTNFEMKVNGIPIREAYIPTLAEAVWPLHYG